MLTMMARTRWLYSQNLLILKIILKSVKFIHSFERLGSTPENEAVLSTAFYFSIPTHLFTIDAERRRPMIQSQIYSS